MQGASWAQEKYSKRFRLVSAATVNNTLFAAGPVKLGRFFFSNSLGTIAFVKIYDKATAPVAGTDTPILTLCVPGATTGGISIGLLATALVNGFGIAITAVGTDADTTSVGLGQVVVNFMAN